MRYKRNQCICTHLIGIALFDTGEYQVAKAAIMNKVEKYNNLEGEEWKCL
jgi:hypothetical protein